MVRRGAFHDRLANKPRTTIAMFCRSGAVGRTRHQGAPLLGPKRAYQARVLTRFARHTVMRALHALSSESPHAARPRPTPSRWALKSDRLKALRRRASNATRPAANWIAS